MSVWHHRIKPPATIVYAFIVVAEVSRLPPPIPPKRNITLLKQPLGIAPTLIALLSCSCDRIYESSELLPVSLLDKATFSITTSIESPPEETSVSTIVVVDFADDGSAQEVSVSFNDGEAITTTEPTQMQDHFSCADDCVHDLQIHLENDSYSAVELLISAKSGAYSFEGGGLGIEVVLTQQ